MKYVFTYIAGVVVTYFLMASASVEMDSHIINMIIMGTGGLATWAIANRI